MSYTPGHYAGSRSSSGNRSGILKKTSWVDQSERSHQTYNRGRKPQPKFTVSTQPQGNPIPHYSWFSGITQFQKGRDFKFPDGQGVPIAYGIPLLNQKDIGINTTGVLLKQLMVNKSSCYQDGISTISVPVHMPVHPMVKPMKVSSGSLVTKLTLLFPPMFRQGILLFKKLSLLGFRLVRFCLKAIMLKAQEGLLLIAGQVHVLNHVDPIIVH